MLGGDAVHTVVLFSTGDATYKYMAREIDKTYLSAGAR
jgi:hypothetical protein